MKIGDIVMSTKVRPYDNAKIVKVEVKKVHNEKRNREEIRTTYTAEYPDKTNLIFYGFNINKSVFKVMEHDGQMCLSDFMTYPGEEESEEMKNE